jgi:large subunit ribosomal protein L31e
MAKKNETKPKIVLERDYVIPIRRETLKVPFHKKAKKAAKAVKEFIIKHMKSQDVKMGKYLNIEIWKHGMKNPPNKVKVHTTKDSQGKVFVEIQGAPKEVPKVEEKKGKKEAKKTEDKSGPESEKYGSKTQEKELEKKVEESKKERAKVAKKVEKEEVKELKKIQPKQPAPKMPPQQKQPQARPTAPKSA